MTVSTLKDVREKLRWDVMQAYQSAHGPPRLGTGQPVYDQRAMLFQCINAATTGWYMVHWLASDLDRYDAWPWTERLCGKRINSAAELESWAMRDPLLLGCRSISLAYQAPLSPNNTQPLELEVPTHFDFATWEDTDDFLVMLANAELRLSDASNGQMKPQGALAFLSAVEGRWDEIIADMSAIDSQ